MTPDELKNEIESLPNKTLTIYIILMEDVYETKFGDGYFGYFETAFRSPADAVNFIKQKKSETHEFTAYHIKITDVTLVDNDFRFISNFSRFDTIPINKVIELL